MAWKWKTTPVYPGVKLTSGKDTFYEPDLEGSGLYYSKELIPDNDVKRIYKQT